MPVGGRAEYLEDPLDPQQRDDQIVLLRRNPTASAAIRVEEFLHGIHIKITVRCTAERPTAGSQVPYQPVGQRRGNLGQARPKKV